MIPPPRAPQSLLSTLHAPSLGGLRQYRVVADQHVRVRASRAGGWRAC